MNSQSGQPNDNHEHLIRVLLVDDMPQVRQDLRQLLELAGRFQIVGEARDGLEAVHLAESCDPDAVVMDLEMPGMDGYEAAHRIKLLWPAIRVIILSVHAGREERQRARAVGADAFVTKGNNYQVLMDAIAGMSGSEVSFHNEK